MKSDNFKEFMQAEQVDLPVTKKLDPHDPKDVLKAIGLGILYIGVGGIQLALLIGFIALFFYYPLPMLALTVFIGIFFNPLKTNKFRRNL